MTAAAPVQPGICTWARGGWGQVYMPCNISGVECDDSPLFWPHCVLPGHIWRITQPGLCPPDQAPSASWWRDNTLGGHPIHPGVVADPRLGRGYAWVYLFTLDQGTVHLPKRKEKDPAASGLHTCASNHRVGNRSTCESLHWPHKYPSA